jgi:hypothetical protein
MCIVIIRARVSGRDRLWQMCRLCISLFPDSKPACWNVLCNTVTLGAVGSNVLLEIDNRGMFL